MNQLLLTFDYELFLGGKSGTVNNCLIKPTDLILKLLKKNNLSSIFFVDTIYLYRLKEIAQLNINARIEYPQYNSVDLVPGFLHRAKFPYWKGNTSISFTYSALFSADKRKILKLDKQVYINLSDELTSLYDHGGTNGYVLERLWLYILDGF